MPDGTTYEDPPFSWWEYDLIVVGSRDVNGVREVFRFPNLQVRLVSHPLVRSNSEFRGGFLGDVPMPENLDFFDDVAHWIWKVHQIGVGI